MPLALGSHNLCVSEQAGDQLEIEDQPNQREKPTFFSSLQNVIDRYWEISNPLEPAPQKMEELVKGERKDAFIKVAKILNIRYVVSL